MLRSDQLRLELAENKASRVEQYNTINRQDQNHCSCVRGGVAGIVQTCVAGIVHRSQGALAQKQVWWSALRAWRGSPVDVVRRSC